MKPLDETLIGDHVMCVDNITPIGLIRRWSTFNFNVGHLNNFNVAKSQDRFIDENGLTTVFITTKLYILLYRLWSFIIFNKTK